MDDQLNEWGKVRWIWLGALVISEFVGLLIGWRYGGLALALLVTALILVLFFALFGAYYFWRRSRARSWRRAFSAAIQAQATVAPRSVSDPNQRAALDRLRQKFQAGLNEFTSRGRDIYKLPWYLIIGEPGSGKSEAIRHSGIDFPPGLQNELQGSGGTVNMDWWFTNQGVILDTAGRLLFSETPAGQAPEWTEFLRLLRKARGQCPINGLFIVLSVESLIKDSAERIAQKASRMAQQLDLIQRTLDVRFPVYLLVSKCDLLTGFRDFFESIDDPILQHQMFGWANPDPLDAPFRADLVEEHLKSVAERVRRRRLWLLRESFARRLGQADPSVGAAFLTGTSTAHRAEEAESLFALPESILRLAPRLRRYLEKIFVTGEWSAKPVFLRGIFFTSSMREGKALDEAIALATGLPLEQLPEDQSWEKERAFFLRDMFLEKVFRESGLVTRATSTRKLLRQRSLALYATAAAGLAVWFGLALFGYKSLNASARREAEFWRYAARNWEALTPPIVSGPDEKWQFAYAGNETVPCRMPLLESKPTLVELHRTLATQVDKPFPRSGLFRPLAWLRSPGEPRRREAQRRLFEQWVVKPLVVQTRLKMMAPNSAPADPSAMERHREALLALMQLEADAVAAGPSGSGMRDAQAAQRYLTAFLSYLVGKEVKPDPDLVGVMTATFGPSKGPWPPEDLLFGQSLTKNAALGTGLANYHAGALYGDTNLFRRVAAIDALVDSLKGYARQELAWLNGTAASCSVLRESLQPARSNVTARLEEVRAASEAPMNGALDLSGAYTGLRSGLSNAPISTLLAAVNAMTAQLPNSASAGTLFQEIRSLLERWQSQPGGLVEESYRDKLPALAALQRDHLALINNRPAFDARWQLYSKACELESSAASAGGRSGRTSPDPWAAEATEFENRLLSYEGPLAEPVVTACSRIVAAARQLREKNGQASAR